MALHVTSCVIVTLWAVRVELLQPPLGAAGVQLHANRCSSAGVFAAKPIVPLMSTGHVTLAPLLVHAPLNETCGEVSPDVATTVAVAVNCRT